MSNKIKQNIIDALIGSKKVLLTGHTNPDGDSLGSILGLAGMLKAKEIDYSIVNEGAIPDKYKFLPDIEQVIDAEKAVAGQTVFDTAVVIECSNLERIGKVQELIDDNCQIINIDHHQDNIPFGKINLKTPEASAAGEMIFDILQQGDFKINKNMAACLYTAILTDTGRFRFKSTSSRTMEIAGKLIDCGADPPHNNDKIYYCTENAYFNLCFLKI